MIPTHKLPNHLRLPDGDAGRPSGGATPPPAPSDGSNPASGSAGSTFSPPPVVPTAPTVPMMTAYFVPPASVSRPSNRLAVEQLILFTMGKIEDGAEGDLRALAERVQENMEKKALVRKAENLARQIQTAIDNNKPEAATAAKEELRALLTSDPKLGGLGIDLSKVSEFPNFDEIPDRNSRVFKDPEDKSARETANNGIMKQLTTYLDGLAQNFSDLGTKLQFDLQMFNDIYNRAQKAKSDILASYGQTWNKITGNFRG